MLCEALEGIPGLASFPGRRCPRGEFLQDLSRLVRADALQHLNSADRAPGLWRWCHAHGGQERFDAFSRLRRGLAYKRLSQSRLCPFSQRGQLLARRFAHAEPIAVKLSNQLLDTFGIELSRRSEMIRQKGNGLGRDGRQAVQRAVALAAIVTGKVSP